VYFFCLTIYLHAPTASDYYFSSNQNTALFIQEPREDEEHPCVDTRNLGARDRGLSDYYSESSILESSTRRWVSDPPDAPSIDERSGHNGFHSARSAVVTFGGPKFLTLQITSTRKRKSAVYFVCGAIRDQSLSAPRASSMLMKRGWFIESFPPY